MYYTYILQSKTHHTFYIGSSTDIKKRLQQHNQHSVQSTKSHAPYRLVWYCAFKQKTNALHFEKYLKTGSGMAFARKRFLAHLS